MGHVDALSRCQVVSIVQPDDIDFQLQLTQSRDQNIVSLRNELKVAEQDRIELKDGLVYRRFTDNKLMFYVPVEMEVNVVRTIHEQTGQLGVNKCYNQTRRCYWFPEKLYTVYYHYVFFACTNTNEIYIVFPKSNSI